MAGSKKNVPRERPGRRRALAFRLCAVFVALAPFVLCELVLRTFGWGAPTSYDDPFVGFSAVYPLFVLNEAGDRYEIPKSRQEFFWPDWFAAKKGEREFRVFCLGGSTVQGRPYAIETSFTRWLEISLQTAEPDRDWRVVNCGGISYASYRLVPILEEVLGHEPDLIIVYTGQNEFLEDRTYDEIKHAPPLVAALEHGAARLHTYTLARHALRSLFGADSKPPADRPVLSDETDAILDYRDGLAAYHRNEPWKQGVMAHYRFNLFHMVDMANAAGVPLILINPTCSLADCPPFKWQHTDGLSREQLERVERLWQQAQDAEAIPAAVAQLREALAIDPENAGLWYHLAVCHQDVGLLEQARREFLNAKDLDICPLRLLEPMNESVLEVAKETGTPLVDARKMFDDLSPGRIPGRNLLVDHVHPGFHGHQLIAQALFDKMQEMGLVHPEGNEWQEERDERYRTHFDALDAVYFVRAQERLKGLLAWAAGRASRIRPPQPMVIEDETPPRRESAASPD